MKKSNFTDNQIIGIVAEVESGRKINDICREHGITQATFYNWRKKYAGMQPNQLKRLRELEAELSQFKRMYADIALQNQVLKDVIEKKL
jgi:putative transposase